jgi:hypothetical protein
MLHAQQQRKRATKYGRNEERGRRKEKGWALGPDFTSECGGEKTKKNAKKTKNSSRFFFFFSLFSFLFYLSSLLFDLSQSQRKQLTHCPNTFDFISQTIARFIGRSFHSVLRQF